MAVDIFLKLDGIKGESADDKHKGEIEVLAWGWGASQLGTAGTATGGGAGKVNVQDLSVTKFIDKASTDLFLATCTGKHLKKATLTVRKAGEKPLEYLIVDMENVFISSVSPGGSRGDDRLTENISLNFAKFEMKYVPQKEDGSGDSPVAVKFDIAANVKK